MKPVRIVIASIVCAVLALVAINLPASMTPSAFAGSALASPLPPGSGTCTARAVVNIRQSPSSRARLVGRLPRKGVFTITARSSRWVQGNSQWGNGWVMAALLRCSK